MAQGRATVGAGATGRAGPGSLFLSSEPRSPRGRRAGALRRGRDGAARRELEGGRAAGAGGSPGSWGDGVGAEGKAQSPGEEAADTERDTWGQRRTGPPLPDRLTGPRLPGPALLVSLSSRIGTPRLLRGQTPSSAVAVGPSVCWRRLGEIRCLQTIASP